MLPTRQGSSTMPLASSTLSVVGRQIFDNAVPSVLEQVNELFALLLG